MDVTGWASLVLGPDSAGNLVLSRLMLLVGSNKNVFPKVWSRWCAGDFKLFKDSESDQSARGGLYTKLRLYIGASDCHEGNKRSVRGALKKAVMKYMSTQALQEGAAAQGAEAQ